MPTSFYGQISTILDLVIQTKAKSILDIGVGFGKYGVLCREMLDIPFERYGKETWQIKIDGIEGYKPYKNPIHSYVYNKIYYDSIGTAIKKINIQYDLGLFIDVLEHFDKIEGEKIIDEILKKCHLLIISTPEIPYPQKYLDNALENHRSIWSLNDFEKYNIKVFGSIPMGIDNSNLIVLLSDNL
ncbi:MAG: hypothetical protein PHC34_09895 [Candidatus Gastranaerophilales bacterium]|nr:hypothetical protein [Candidatus Gastranaerophilales bacterium]